MCYSNVNKRPQPVEKVEPETTNINLENDMCIGELPEHNDSISIDRDLHTGILGFRYENKNEELIVYSSPEAKTLCIMMRKKPMK